MPKSSVFVKKIPGITCCCVYLAGALLTPVLAQDRAEDEEFIGPFASWSNLRTNYGPNGADLQRALNEIGESGHPSTLYIPAGNYCVQPLALISKLGVNIIGNDPQNTVLRYCGPERGTLFRIDGVAYSKFSRLTFDCAGKAEIAVDQSWGGKKPRFDTANEYSDVFFRNCKTAIRGGGEGFGFAETTILRARFGPSTGTCILLKNFNALDLWVWYSLFDRCQTGISNDPGAGNFSVYNSVFRRSAFSDMYIHNTGGFNIRNNTSVESTAFWTTSPAFAYPAYTNIQGNSLIGVSQPAIRIRNQGPAIVMDNRFEGTRESIGPVVSADALGDTDLLTVGNAWTSKNGVVARGRFVSVDDRTESKLHLKEPVLPGVPPNLHRRILEISRKANAAEIQHAIDTAAKSGDKRAVIHFPEGSFNVDTTLEVPAGSDMQIVGDGWFVTRLNWSGKGDGPLIHVAGPSGVIFREIGIAATKAQAVVVTGVDQPRSRVYFQQTHFNGTIDAGLLVDGLDHTLIDLRNIGHGGNGPGPAIQVKGGKLAAAGTPAEGRTDLFSGASSGNALSYALSNGGRLLVRDIWYESGTAGVWARLQGNGVFTMQGTRVALPANQQLPAVDVADFRGSAAFLTSKFDDRIVSAGDGTDGRLLVLGLESSVNLPDFLWNHSMPPERANLLLSRSAVRGGSSVVVPNQGNADPAFLREMLAQTRAEQPAVITRLPSGVSDVRFYRVMIERASTGIHLLP